MKTKKKASKKKPSLKVHKEEQRKAPSAIGLPGVDKELDKSSPKLY